MTAQQVATSPAPVVEPAYSMQELAASLRFIAQTMTESSAGLSDDEVATVMIAAGDLCRAAARLEGKFGTHQETV